MLGMPLPQQMRSMLTWPKRAARKSRSSAWVRSAGANETWPPSVAQAW